MTRERHHILLVDDDIDDGFLTSRALKKVLSERSTVQLVDGGNKAIAYMIGEGDFRDRDRYPFPTVVITDLNMPEGDGFDVLEFMQRNREWSVVPRIMYSSSDDDDDVRTAFFLGASAYHLKPSQSGERDKSMREIVEYWSTCQVPPVDIHGRLANTRSVGRRGARYPQPRGALAMKRPGLPSAPAVSLHRAKQVVERNAGKAGG